MKSISDFLKADDFEVISRALKVCCGQLFCPPANTTCRTIFTPHLQILSYFPDLSHVRLGSLCTQSLNLLINNPLNIKKLKTGNLMSILSDLADHEEANINQTASMILDTLSDSVNCNEAEVGKPAALADITNVAAVAAPAHASSAAAPTPSKRAATYLSTIVFSVPALANNAAIGLRVDKLLVTQSGVVSASIDQARNRVTVYSSAFTKDRCQPLLDVLETAGFAATVIDPAGAAAATVASAAVAGKENSGRGYLDASQFGSASATPRKGGSLAMAVYREANEDASLQARVARKQVADKQQEQKQQGLVGRLSSWFW